MSGEAMNKTQVLIVEDEVILAMSMRMMLESRGYHVVGIATTGLDAVALAGRTSPALVLMDIMLPGSMNGIEAARLIKSTDRPDTRIVYVSGNADEQTKADALRTHPAGFLEKPFEDEELCLILDHALGGDNLTLWE